MTRIRGEAYAAVALAGLWIAGQPQSGQVLSFRPTQGAAPGYVDDAICANCHQDRARSFAAVGMQRSFGPPRPESTPIPGGSVEFAHPPSADHFRMGWRDNELWFERWQVDDAQRPLHHFETRVDWVVGSGNHAQVFLFRTPSAELYQLPVARYASASEPALPSGWGMAPGFDRPDHEGVSRRVRRECLFCHNAFPEVPATSDQHFAPQTFPERLPHGIGCQRCHGPGSKHVELAHSGASDERIRPAVVSPQRLDPSRRDDVCFQCHLQPAVAQPGVRRLGRGDYSFRPGEALDEYLVQIDAEVFTESGAKDTDRFEINHHPYRLLQSACWNKSGGRLSCLTCHDPHRKVAPAARAAHYRAACLSCHAVTDCPTESATHSPAAPETGRDCSDCHMPARRPSDVVHTVMTDHRIQRSAPSESVRLAARREEQPSLGTVRMFPRERASPANAASLYAPLAVVRAHGGLSAEAVERLAAALARETDPAPEAVLDLAAATLQQRRFADSQRTLDTLMPRLVTHPHLRQPAIALLAQALAAQGKAKQGLALLLPFAVLEEASPETIFNAGRLSLDLGDPTSAVELLRRVCALRPNQASAHYQLGRAHLALDHTVAAEVAFRAALSADPRLADAAIALAELLVRAGRQAEAVRLLEHAERGPRIPAAVTSARLRMAPDSGPPGERRP
jgi:Flp pilus assembly protein TadD